MVATLLPSADHLHVIGAGPRAVAAPTAHAVAAEVRSRLLPEFEQLVNLARLREMQEDLDWLRDDVEPGTVPYPYPAPLDAALEPFVIHAPYLIPGSRRAGAKPLAAQDAKVLDRFETLLASLTQSSDGAGSAGSNRAAPMRPWRCGSSPARP
ncbi:hypothetical protein RM704_14130 [Streptomyces sp. DSM 3412]|uniref:Uncharacterized protein n=1 Tax=Streptomyces gottesmaniae TaxID=3075518 RepID=A0ABU2YWI1_9ACTN|nr:hypothetical protein [Streptomyces sp. DSM 3412]MDT0568591.1 hypothetical protein [Streptomyces sp. DSM 3412]